MTNENLPFEERAYEMEDLWKVENMNEREVERVSFTASLIPEDVRSVADIGCGNGLFLNHLATTAPGRFSRLCGVDRSRSALEHVGTEKLQCSIERLPFFDGEFDMATCLEVLEHLPVSIYGTALSEVARISRKYVFISVPNDQDLEESLVNCPQCPTKFNPDYHLRSFNRHSLEVLLNGYGYRCLDVFQIGRTVEYAGRKKILRLLGRKKASPPWYAVCPACGYHDEVSAVPKEAQVDKRMLKEIIKKLWPKKIVYRWIGGLYQKVS